MRLFWQILVAIVALDQITRRVQRLASNVSRVGSHVGDQTHAIAIGVDAFVELLGDAHGAIGGESELARGRHLQGAGLERRHRSTRLALGFNADHSIAHARADAAGNGADHARRALAARIFTNRERHAFKPSRLDRGLHWHSEILGIHCIGNGFELEFLAANLDEFRFKRALLGEERQSFLLRSLLALVIALRQEFRNGLGDGVALGQLRGQAHEHLPRFGRNELANILLALDNQTRRDRLHAARAQSALAHDAPQQRRDSVTHDAVKDAPRVLRVDTRHVDRTRMLERFADRALGDRVEHHALGVLWLHIEDFSNVPRDRLSLAVQVGCEPHIAGGLLQPAEFRHQFAAIGGDDIGRCKRLHINAWNVHRLGRGLLRLWLALLGAWFLGRHFGGVLLGRLLGQVADMPLARFDDELPKLAQILLDRLRLRGALDDDQRRSCSHLRVGRLGVPNKAALGLRSSGGSTRRPARGRALGRGGGQLGGCRFFGGHRVRLTLERLRLARFIGRADLFR